MMNIQLLYFIVINATSTYILYFFFLIIRRPPRSPLFPSTPLFRSRPAGDAPDHLADKMALGPRVIARCGAGLPPRGLRGEPGGRLLPVVHVLQREGRVPAGQAGRSEEHTSELQSRQYLVCRLLLEQ